MARSEGIPTATFAYQGVGGWLYKRNGTAYPIQTVPSIDVCTANEPRPTNGRPEKEPNGVTCRFINQANINNCGYGDLPKNGMFGFGFVRRLASVADGLSNALAMGEFVQKDEATTIDTDIASVPDSTANTAVPAKFAGLVGRGTVH